MGATAELSERARGAGERAAAAGAAAAMADEQPGPPAPAPTAASTEDEPTADDSYNPNYNPNNPFGAVIADGKRDTMCVGGAGRCLLPACVALNAARQTC